MSPKRNQVIPAMAIDVPTSSPSSSMIMSNSSSPRELTGSSTEGSSVFTNKIPRRRKATIPKALRQQVWIQYAGNAFDTKCPIRWCPNIITVFDFHVGHNLPESQGGTLTLDNLLPLCARCNLSMGSQYTIDEWQLLGPPTTVDIVTSPKKLWCCGWLA